MDGEVLSGLDEVDVRLLIVIVGINHWDDLTHPFFDSIVRHEPGARVVIVDNASDKPYRHDLCWIERSNERLGFPAAINLALEKTLYWDKAIVFNNDCICDGKFIESVEQADNCTFFGSDQNKRENQYNFVYSAWMVISKEIWDKVGRFDESLDAGWEDFDYEARCQDAGINVDVMKIPVTHIGRSTRKEEADYMKRWDVCRKKFGEKYGIRTVRFDGKPD